MKSDLELELENWRSDCFDVFIEKVHYGNRNALHEIAETYKLAINQHTSVMLMDKPILSQYIYKQEWSQIEY